MAIPLRLVTLFYRGSQDLDKITHWVKNIDFCLKIQRWRGACLSRQVLLSFKTSRFAPGSHGVRSALASCIVSSGRSELGCCCCSLIRMMTWQRNVVSRNVPYTCISVYQWTDSSSRTAVMNEIYSWRLDIIETVIAATRQLDNLLLHPSVWPFDCLSVCSAVRNALFRLIKSKTVVWIFIKL